MVTDQLKAVVERAGKLAPDRQDNIAREILQKIEAAEWDEKWEETLASPASIAYEERMRAKRNASNNTDCLTLDELGKLFPS